MKLLKLIAICIVLLIIVISFGCKDNSTSSTSDKIEEILPLAKGNYWIYRTDYYVDSTLQATDHITGFEMDTMWVVRDSMIGNERWFAVKHSSDEKNQRIGEDFFINRVDGLYKLSLQQQRGSYRYPTVDLIIKKSVQIGDSTVDGSSVTKVMSLSDSVNINNNHYLCRLYKTYNLPDSTIVGKERFYLEYFSMKTGDVRYEYYLENKLFYQTNLLSYKFN